MVALEGKSDCHVPELMTGERREKCAKAAISSETETGSLWSWHTVRLLEGTVATPRSFALQ